MLALCMVFGQATHLFRKEPQWPLLVEFFKCTKYIEVGLQ